MCNIDILMKHLDVVGEMSNNGYSEEEIAEKLNLSISEVHTIINYYNY